MEPFQHSAKARVRLAGDGSVIGTADAASWQTSPHAPVMVRLDDGRQFQAPRDMLRPRDDGSFELSLGRTDLAKLTEALGADAKNLTVVPVVAEELQVGKRSVETGRVRITKVVREQEQVFDQPLMTEEVTVERVPVGRFLDAPPEVRREGETLVIPLVEEVVVIEKRLRLKEEVRITRRAVETRSPQTVTVRSEDVEVKRIPAAAEVRDGTAVAKG